MRKYMLGDAAMQRRFFAKIVFNDESGPYMALTMCRICGTQFWSGPQVGDLPPHECALGDVAKDYMTEAEFKEFALQLQRRFNLRAVREPENT